MIKIKNTANVKEYPTFVKKSPNAKNDARYTKNFPLLGPMILGIS
jgi:hypothetical protein